MKSLSALLNTCLSLTGKPFSLFKIVTLGTSITRLLWSQIKSVFIFRTFCSLALGLIPFVQAYCLGTLIDSYLQPDTTTAKAILPSLLLVVAAVGSAILNSTRTSLANIFYWKGVYTTQILFNDRVSSLDIARIEEPETQNLIVRVSENFFSIVRYLDRVFPIVEVSIRCIIAFAILATLSPFLILCIFIFSIPQLIIDVLYGKAVYSMEASISEDRRRGYLYSTYLRDKHKLLELKLFGARGHFISKLSELNNSFISKRTQVDARYGLLRSLWSVLAETPGVLFIFLLFQQMRFGQLSLGDFTLNIAVLTSFRSSLMELFGLFGEQSASSAFVDDFIHLCGLKPIIKTPDPHTALSIPSNELPPEIEFDGVSFTYPGHTIPTIRDVSFKVQPGEKIAIVGEIGAGKTTLLKLLFRIYTPTEGRILVNGNDIGEISLESWYSSLGVMLQEFNHYFFSIRENIALGKPGNLTIDTDVIEAAQNAGVYAFVKNLPNGFDTITDRVFLGGTDLSKGQNQLLALSRLLYRGANIIVLDEPTSALDAISEEKAFEHLEQLKNTTMIFIAHRLSTVRQADTIYVLERGKIKEFGSHEELMMQNNSYAELYSTQAQYYQ